MGEGTVGSARRTSSSPRSIFSLTRSRGSTSQSVNGPRISAMPSTRNPAAVEHEMERGDSYRSCRAMDMEIRTFRRLSKSTHESEGSTRRGSDVRDTQDHERCFWIQFLPSDLTKIVATAAEGLVGFECLGMDADYRRGSGAEPRRQGRWRRLPRPASRSPRQETRAARWPANTLPGPWNSPAPRADRVRFGFALDNLWKNRLLQFVEHLGFAKEAHDVYRHVPIQGVGLSRIRRKNWAWSRGNSTPERHPPGGPPLIVVSRFWPKSTPLVWRNAAMT